MRNTEELIKYIEINVPNCPVLLIQEILNRTQKQFFRNYPVWLKNGVFVYNESENKLIADAPHRCIVEKHSCQYNGSEILTEKDGDHYKINKNYTDAKIVFQVSALEGEIDDEIFERVRNYLILKTSEELYRIPGRTWSSIEISSYYNAMGNQELSSLLNENIYTGGIGA